MEALAAFGPAGFRRQVATLWQSPAAEEEAAAASDDTDKQAADKKSSDQAPTDRSEKAAAGEPHLAADAPSVDTPTTEPATEPTPAPNEISEPKAIVPPAGAAEDATAPTAPEPPAATTPSSDDADAPPPLAIDDASAPATQPAASPPTDEAMPKDARAAAAAPVRQEPADGFGRFTSKKDVLLRFDSAAANWPRLASMSPLAKGDQLMSLPLFRPAITLSSSITVQCDGPAKFELAGWSEAGVPIIAIDYGKFLMLNGGKAANPLELKLGDTDVQLTFVDPESEAALEVRHVLPPGQNPEAGPAPLAVELYAKSGTLRIRDGAAANELKAPARQRLATGRREQPTGGDFPKWVTDDAISEYERGATAAIEPLLQPDRPVELVMREESTHRRREVRTLAIRSLGYLGDFDACIEALNDKDERATWSAYFDELRQAVARGPETAARVRESYEKLAGPRPRSSTACCGATRPTICAKGPTPNWSTG